MIKDELNNIIDEIYRMNEDAEDPSTEPAKEEPIEQAAEEKPAEQEQKPSTDVRSEIRSSIESGVNIAKSIILESIPTAFKDDCGKSKKIATMEEQIKNWEKTIRGTCQQIVTIVENKDFIPDSTNCSPRAYKKIRMSDSRDLSVIDLCAAIIVFHNSLG
jgi:hypothetical protein